MKRILITLLFSVLLLAGCAPSGPNVRPEPETRDPSVLSERGRHDAAAERWLELAAERELREPALAARARLSAAEAWLQHGRPERARLAVADLNSSLLSAEERIRLDLVLAELALIDGDFETASWILAIPTEQIPAELQARFRSLSEQVNLRNPDSIQARIQRIRDALERGDFEPDLALASLLDQPQASLQNALDRAVVDDDIALLPWLELSYSARRFLLDDASRSQAFTDWQRQYASLGWTEEAAEQSVQVWKATQSRPNHVAVLLPAEGALQRAGEVLRDGLVSAWLELPEPQRPRLSFYYLEDRPDAAVGAWFQARDDGVDALIGPLDRRQIRPLLQLPDSGIPMLLLNRPQQTPEFMPAIEPARSVSILALPPEEEAELAAVHALIQGYSRALVIARSSDWGARVADRFIETFELGGGRVLSRADYDAQTFDHTDQLEVLLHLDRSERRIATLAEVLGQPIEAQAKRRTDAELIFMAAPGGDARQLMPQLRFLDAGDLAIYATSHVYSNARNDRDLQDIQFPASPWLLQDSVTGGLRQQVQRQFPGLSSLSLSQLHALGRDAMALLPWLDEMKRDRQLYLAGQVGRLRLSDGVIFERDLPWARIDQGRPVEYSQVP